MKENADRNVDFIPVADLAAEATNDSSPAQAIPEAIPPRARAGRERPQKPQPQEKPRPRVSHPVPPS